MSGTRFSVIVTCHDQLDFIRSAVDSALTQRYPQKEVIVVDDGSSDGSVGILRQYGDSIQLVEFADNRGAIEARNHGAARAEAEYLVFLDGDDLLMPWALDVYERTVVECEAKIIFSRLTYFKGEIPRLREVPRKIECVDYECLMVKDRSAGLSASSFVIDRQAFGDVGGWSPGIFHLDCVDLAMKLGYSGKMIMICSPSTCLYRIHATNSIHTVPPFLRVAHRLMGKERAGEYPGGRAHRSERYAYLGGVLLFWVRRAYGARLYRDALWLAISGWSMILAAIARRSVARIKGRHPVETLELRLPERAPKVTIAP
jgi:glycosyltransferase involved in cell wall biosynthesis